MYNLSSTVIDLFKNYARQTILIHFDGVDAELDLTNSDIVSGTFSIDRYSVSGDTIEIGTASAAELTFTLNNSDGKFDDITLEGAELFVRVQVMNGDTACIVPLGYFIIDTPPRKRTTIEVTALDRMRKFDQLIDTSLFTDGLSVGAYIQLCCSKCGNLLATDISSLPNINYSIPSLPDDSEMTYRKIIQKCCEITGTCGYMDWNGQLRLEWYSDNTSSTTVKPSDRYTGADLYENDIKITGITIIDSEGTEYLSGEEGYTIDISDNSLIQGDYQDIIDNIADKIVGFSYRPYSCEIKPMPHLYPLDEIDYVDNKGVTHSTIITNITFKANKHTEMSAQGETQTNNDYYVPRQTKRQAEILAAIQAAQDAADAAQSSADNAQETADDAQSAAQDAQSTADNAQSAADNAQSSADAAQSTANNAQSTANYVQTEVEALKDYVNDYIEAQTTVDEEQETLILNLNNMIANALGLYVTTVTNTDGSVSYYFHDAESRADSNIIYTFNSGGFAWTNNWNNGNPIWTYGITADGNAVLNYLSVNKLTADYINVQSLIASGEFVAYSEDGSTLLSITNEGIAISSENFTLTTSGYIKAVAGTIAGFTIAEDCLTNSDGTSYISIASGDYESTIKSTRIGIFKTVNSETVGSYLTSTDIRVVYSDTSSNYSSLIFEATYLKRTNASSYDGKNTTVYEGCITTNSGSYTVDSSATSSGGSFIIGCSRTVKKSPYAGVYEWGAYIRFADYQTVELCYDSNLGGGIYLKDVYTSSSNLIAAPYIETAYITISISSGNTISSSTFTDSSTTAYLQMITCGFFKILAIRWTDTLSNDKWAKIDLSDYLSTIYTAQVSANATTSISLSGDTHSGNQCVVITTTPAVYVGQDGDSSANGFRLLVIGK